MAPNTRRREKAICQWKLPHFPTEILDMILSINIAETIHDVFYEANNLGIYLHDPSKSPHKQPIKKVSVPWTRRMRTRYMDLFDGLQKFQPVLYLAHTCHQYRFTVEGILARVCPKEIPFLDLQDQLPDYLREKLLAMEQRYQDSHPILKLMCSLQSFALCSAGVGSRFEGKPEDVKSAEKFYSELASLESIREMPFTFLFLLHSRLRVNLYGRVAGFQSAQDEEAFQTNLFESANMTPAMTPWERTFLSRIIDETCTLYDSFRTVVSAQIVGAGIIMMAPPLMASTHGPPDEERLEWLTRHSNALLDKFTEGLDLSCAFTQQLKGFQRLSLRFDEFTPSSERLKAETRDEMKAAAILLQNSSTLVSTFQALHQLVDQNILEVANRVVSEVLGVKGAIIIQLNESPYA